jgi:hypothetical protein
MYRVVKKTKNNGSVVVVTDPRFLSAVFIAFRTVRQSKDDEIEKVSVYLDEVHLLDLDVEGMKIHYALDREE